MKIVSLLVLIFSYTLLSAQDIKPTLSMAVVKVKAVDDKGKPQEKNTITFSSLKDNKQYSGITDKNGKFTLMLPPAQKYKLKYKAFATVESNLVLDMPVSAQPYTIEYTITATPPQSFTLDNVFFDSGKSTLRPESSKELNELAEYMQLQKTLVIEIAGHTDNVGTAEANLKLSDSRAVSVKTFLEKKDIASNRVLAKGYGDTEPESDNSTPSGRQKNRRTEVRIISQ